jgi:hypothetical protein
MHTLQFIEVPLSSQAEAIDLLKSLNGQNLLNYLYSGIKVPKCYTRHELVDFYFDVLYEIPNPINFGEIRKAYICHSKTNLEKLGVKYEEVYSIEFDIPDTWEGAMLAADLSLLFFLVAKSKYPEKFDGTWKSERFDETWQPEMFDETWEAA